MAYDYEKSKFNLILKFAGLQGYQKAVPMGLPICSEDSLEDVMQMLSKNKLTPERLAARCVKLIRFFISFFGVHSTGYSSLLTGLHFNRCLMYDAKLTRAEVQSMFDIVEDVITAEALLNVANGIDKMSRYVKGCK